MSVTVILKRNIKSHRALTGIIQPMWLSVEAGQLVFLEFELKKAITTNQKEKREMCALTAPQCAIIDLYGGQTVAADVYLSLHFETG